MAADRFSGMTAKGRLRGAALLTLALAQALPAAAQPLENAPTAVPAPAALSPQPPVPRPAGGPSLAPFDTTSGTERLGDRTPALTLPPITRPRAPDVRIERLAPGDGDTATLMADHVTLSEGRRLTASGGVVVWYRGTRLVASEVIYDGAGPDGKGGGVTIRGPIHMTQPDRTGRDNETILIADAAQLDPNLQDGILRGARLVLARELQLAATEIRRSGEGRFTTLDHVISSSCRICAEDPTPLWEIRARRIIHDAQERKLHFEWPQLRVMGVPVGTVPAITAPDPTVERMTGLLRPGFRTTSRLGFGIKLPYFITLGDSADLTVTPYVSTSRTRTLDLRYRQAFANGAMEWSGALSRDDIVPDETRSYLFGAARFELPGDYRLSLQIQTASDRSYLLDYDITDADRLWSGVMIDRVRRDEFILARAGKYESLREDEENATSPGRVADAMWHRRWRPSLIGGEAGLEWSFHAHQRPSDEDIAGRDAIRGSVSLDWRRSEVLAHGLVGALQARLDADVYRIFQDSRFDDWFLRADPVVGAELRWPLIRSAGAVTHLLEPVVQVIWSPERDWSRDIPNEDSHLIEFDEGNLFSLDRFPGWDARESGLRANLGLTWTRLDPSGWTLAVTAGRVLRSRADPALADSSPLAGRNSDWLLAAQYSHPDGLAIANRSLIDDSLSISRNELRLGWLRPDLQLSAGYLWMDSDVLESRESDVSELMIAGGWQIAEGWWGTAETRYDFTADRAQRTQVGVEYRNECISVEMGLRRRFTSSIDLKPETSFELGVRLAGFGAQDAQKDTRGAVARRACLR